MLLKPVLTSAFMAVALSMPALTDDAADYMQAAKDAYALKSETSAILLARKALKAAKNSGADSRELALYELDLARMAFAFKTKDAPGLMEASLESLKAAFGPEHPAYLPLLLDTADLNAMRGEKERAHAQYNHIIDESARQFGAGGAYHEGMAELRIADMFYWHNQPQKAEEHLSTSLQVLRRTEPEPERLMVAEALLLKGQLALDAKDYERAKEAFEESLAYYEVYGVDTDVMNGRDNRFVRSLMNRLLLIAHQEGNIEKAQTYARRYGLSRYWRTGKLIYDPVLNMHFWEGSEKEGTLRRRIAYQATYTILPSGRATGIDIISTDGVTEEAVKLMLETAYFIPKLEDGLLVSHKTTGGVYSTYANIPVEYATLETDAASP